MPFNAKMLGNVLANRSRGLTSDASKQINPENMPIKDNLDMPSAEPTDTLEVPRTFEVPIATLPNVMEGDVLTVTAIVGDKVSLTVEAATPATEPTVPPIP